MKEIKKLDVAYLEEYDIHVNRYLTYAQIQQIVNSVIKFDSWAEREQNKDMLILFHATDIGADKIEEIEHETFLTSGLLYDVKCQIENLHAIDIAIDYTQSIQRALTQIAKELPKYASKVEEVVKNGGKNKK